MKITKLPCSTKDEARAYIAAQKFTGLGILQVVHDDWCKAIQTQRDADCCATCQPDLYLIEPFAVETARTA